MDTRDWAICIFQATCIVVVVGLIVGGGYKLVSYAAGPIDTTTIHRYHARCLNYGAVVWEGDYIRRGVSVWAYTPEGKELFLPHDGCVTVEQ